MVSTGEEANRFKTKIPKYATDPDIHKLFEDDRMEAIRAASAYWGFVPYVCMEQVIIGEFLTPAERLDMLTYGFCVTQVFRQSKADTLDGGPWQPKPKKAKEAKAAGRPVPIFPPGASEQDFKYVQVRKPRERRAKGIDMLWLMSKDAIKKYLTSMFSLSQDILCGKPVRASAEGTMGHEHFHGGLRHIGHGDDRITVLQENMPKAALSALLRAKRGLIEAIDASRIRERKGDAHWPAAVLGGDQKPRTFGEIRSAVIAAIAETMKPGEFPDDELQLWLAQQLGGAQASPALLTDMVTGKQDKKNVIFTTVNDCVTVTGACTKTKFHKSVEQIVHLVPHETG
jgi:hypothetical protein